MAQPDGKGTLMTETDKKSLQQSLRDTWLNAMGVLTDAETEVAKAAHRVMESVGLRPGAEGEAPANVKEAVRDLYLRVRKNRDELERRLDEGVRAAVDRVNKPIAQELQSLRGRVEKLQRRVEEEIARRNRPQS